MAIIRVKSTDEASQGPFVLIEAEDFIEGVHELYEDAKSGKKDRATLSVVKAEAEEAPQADEDAAAVK